MAKKAKAAGPGCCTYFCGAILIGIVSIISFYAYRAGMPDWYHKTKLPENIEVLDVADTARLKHVLFSGEPWLLQCYSGLPYAGQWLPRPYRLHPAFLESLKGMRSIVKAGTLDCEQMLASNKTLISKFGFVRRTQPLLIYAGGGDRPKQVPAASATSAYGITAFVKPKAEPRVKVASSQKALEAACGGRRACLISRLEPDSAVLEEIARRFRTLEVVSVGGDDVTSLAWGRGDEVGETLEPEEAAFFGQRHSVLRPDPEAPKPTRKGARPPPRLLRAFGGAEDLPSLSRFVDDALGAPADSGWMRTPLPALTAKRALKPKREKKEKRALTAEEEAAAKAKRAERQRAKAEAKAAEQAARAAQDEAREQRSAEQRKQREMERRQQMADEEEAAANILEEVDDDDDDDDEADDDDDDDGTDVMDLDA